MHNLGVPLKTTSTLAFAISFALVKLVSAEVPLGQVVFARSFFAMAPIALYVSMRGGLRAALRTREPHGHLWRACIGLAGMMLWFGALMRLPLADAQALQYAAPLILVVLAATLLRERVSHLRWIAAVLGFAGVLVVLYAHLGTADYNEVAIVGALMALASAVFNALAMTQVRRLTATETTGAIVVYFSGISAGLALFTLPFGWIVPSPADALVLVAIGLTGGIGQALMTEAYRHAEASHLAPLDYTSMVWVLIIGVVVFQDIPDLLGFLGIGAILTAGGLILFSRSRP